MELELNFNEMEFFDFNTIYKSDSSSNIVLMGDDCYMCQECYYR